MVEIFLFRVQMEQGPAASRVCQQGLLCPAENFIAMGSNSAVCGPLGMSLHDPIMPISCKHLIPIPLDVTFRFLETQPARPGRLLVLAFFE